MNIANLTRIFGKSANDELNDFKAKLKKLEIKRFACTETALTISALKKGFNKLLIAVERSSFCTNKYVLNISFAKVGKNHISGIATIIIKRRQKTKVDKCSLFNLLLRG